MSAAGVEISEKNQWQYIYVSSRISDKLKNEYQGDPTLQHLSEYQAGNYIISCMSWTQIIQEARFKLSEVKKELKIKISKEQKQNLLKQYLEEVNF